MNLDEFHLLNHDGKPTAPYDFKICQHLKQTENILVIGQQPYIYRSGVYCPDIGGTILKSKIQKCLYPQFIRSGTIERIYRLFLMDEEITVKADDMNNYPKQWICFKNGLYDPVKQELFPHSPAYRVLNQIPHEFIPYEHPTGNNVDSWLEYIASDPDDREMLLQFLGYSLTRDTRQQKFLILVGTGGSGKSTVIKMLESVVGSDNISNISLKELSQRFASYGLMGKLVNSCADLEISALEDVSLVKKVLGEDSIRAEQKGKDAISFRPYAKFIFSTNQLPIVLSETTNGFYRRLLILKMDRLPDKAKIDFLETLQKETDHFIHLLVSALERMYAGGTIVESQNSKEAVKQLRNDSDTVSAWLDEEMYTDDKTEQREKTYLYGKYSAWCERNDRQPLKRNSLYRSLENKGLVEKKIHGTRYFKGICEKESAPTRPQSSEIMPIQDDPTLPF